MRSRIVLALLMALVATPVFAQKETKDKKKTEEKEKTTTIASKTKGYTVFDGLFKLYQSPKTGKVYMEVREDQLDKEFIYFSHVRDGVVDAGYTRGSYRDARIFKIRKYFNRLEFVLQNTNYYFDPENELSKSANANINAPVILSELIQARNKEDKVLLIKADPLFLTENFQRIKRSSGSSKNPRFSLGKLSDKKTKYLGIHTYPENTDVTVEYVYDQPYPKRSGSEEVTDSRFVSVKIRHSLIAVPENTFEPRFDDPRVGYFMHQVTDMTSVSATPYRDVIHRWHLVKKDPEAAVSEPVEPITWWIENTTPKDLRPVIRDAVLQWNIAFEEAGFKNAVVVKEQPDDADWDAGDIRYNVLRWTSSPRPPFGGYGPSFVNPRTGQILGADIMLEFVYLTNRLRTEKLFELAGLDHMEETPEFDTHACALGEGLHHQTLFGLHVLAADRFPQVDRDEFLKQAVFRLVLHEVGHTLGLNHNFRASTFHTPKELNNKELTMKTGLTGSVMEYPAINISLDPKTQGQFYDIAPGPYDRWAITFGYSPAAATPTAEKERLSKLLARSNEPGLGFGNDADDMRSTGKGIDPRMMIYDLSSDPVAYATDRILLAEKTMGTLQEKYLKEGSTYQELRNAYLTLSREHSTSLNVISRQIGGVYMDRSVVGQEGAEKPFTPVPFERQKQAMDALVNHGFAPNAFQGSDALYVYLQRQRRGFNHFSYTEDPKILDRTLNIQRGVLDQVLHYKVLKRISDSELYGNTYTLSAVMTDLTNGIFAEDLNGKVSSMRQNLQVEYVKRLTTIFGSKTRYGHLSKSMALYELNRINGMMEGADPTADVLTNAHRGHLMHLIERALKPS